MTHLCLNDIISTNRTGTDESHRCHPSQYERSPSPSLRKTWLGYTGRPQPVGSGLFVRVLVTGDTYCLATLLQDQPESDLVIFGAPSWSYSIYGQAV